MSELPEGYVYRSANRFCDDPTRNFSKIRNEKLWAEKEKRDFDRLMKLNAEKIKQTK